MARVLNARVHHDGQQPIQVAREHRTEGRRARLQPSIAVRLQRSEAAVRQQRQRRAPRRAHAAAQPGLHETVRRHRQALREVDQVLPVDTVGVAGDLNAQAGGQPGERDGLRVRYVLLARITVHVVDRLRGRVLAEQVAQAQTGSQAAHRQRQYHIREDLVPDHRLCIAFRAHDLAARRAPERVRYLEERQNESVDQIVNSPQLT